MDFFRIACGSISLTLLEHKEHVETARTIIPLCPVTKSTHGCLWKDAFASEQSGRDKVC